MTEELLENLYGNNRAYQSQWPVYEEAKTIENEVEIAAQINGKVKATLMVGLEEEQDSVREKVMNSDSIKAALAGKNIVKEIYIKGRIYNIVVK
jgi:leucyl-tRNA synthetase